MTLGHRPVVIDGKRVGDLVSLDLKVVFYTTLPTLAALDGKIYDGVSQAMEEIGKAMAPHQAA